MDRKTYEMVTRKAFKTEDPSDLEIKFPRTYKWRWTLNTKHSKWQQPDDQGWFLFTLDKDGNGSIDHGNVDMKAI
jgi:hypothetical protein